MARIRTEPSRLRYKSQTKIFYANSKLYLISAECLQHRHPSESRNTPTNPERPTRRNQSRLPRAVAIVVWWTYCPNTTASLYASVTYRKLAVGPRRKGSAWPMTGVITCPRPNFLPRLKGTWWRKAGVEYRPNSPTCSHEGAYRRVGRALNHGQTSVKLALRRYQHSHQV